MGSWRSVMTSLTTLQLQTSTTPARRPTWLGRDFALEDEVWIDLAYQPGMPKELYEGRTYQPAELAQLCPVGPSHASGGGRAGLRDPRKRPGQQAGTPAERPQPLQRLHGDLLPDPVPPSNEATRLSIYNLTGQLVRVIQSDTQQAGEHRLSWDGRDDYGREVASGVYIYRLDVGEWAEHRCMLLLR